MNTQLPSSTWTPIGNANASLVALAAGSFIDVAVTATGKATHYNDRSTAQAAERRAHADLLEFDREFYAAMLTLPGLTDRSRQLGIRNLLGTQRVHPSRFIDAGQERTLLGALLDDLSVPRRLKLLESLRVTDTTAGIERVNNARTRKLVLRTFLGSRRLDRWAIKYRRKLGRVLTHAWGRRTASILRSILGKAPQERTAKELRILRKEIERWAGDDGHRPVVLHECVGFVLGATQPQYSTARLEQRRLAQHDLRAGIGLPLEVLEGIRGQHHPEISPQTVLQWSRKTLTHGDRIAVQRRAAKAGIDVEFDPRTYDPPKLYLYAYAMGMTEAIASALDDHAARAAARLPFRHRRAGILVDASGSMVGSDEQRLRPMASALALRDMLAMSAEESVIEYAGGTVEGRLVHPHGDTELARGLLRLIRAMPDVIYVISDGYENASAGRFAEVTRELQRIGIRAPIHHLNPVMAAENQGVRPLAPDTVPTLPAHHPRGLALAILRHMLEVTPVAGLQALLDIASIPHALPEVRHDEDRRHLGHA